MRHPESDQGLQIGPMICSKGALSMDPSSDLSAVKDILKKFCTGAFHPDTIHLFRLAWMFAFIKNGRGDKRPGVAGETLQKTAGKAMAIDLRVQWKESSGTHQYGLNTTVLMEY